jgi:NADPH-dependent 7-cyano-7-deazaguanine reductase QueF
MKNNNEDPATRRARIEFRPNPQRSIDYVITLYEPQRETAPAMPVSVTLRYVPDRSVAEPKAWQDYLSYVARNSWDGIEELAAAVLADANNEIVPRWVQVIVEAVDGNGQRFERVAMEDRQPNWKNAELLSRLT